MSKIIIIIATLLALAGAGLGYMNYQAKEQLRTDLDTRTTELQAKTEEAGKEKTEKEAAQTELATTKTDLESTKTSLATATTDLNNTRTELQTAQAALAAAQTSVTDLTAKTEQLQAQVDQSIGLAEQITTLTSELAAAKAQVPTLQAEVDRLQKLVASAPAPGQGGSGTGAAGTASTGGGAAGGQTAAGLSGRVQAVNAGWSFVVLNLGEKDGVRPNAVLDVYRNGNKVGQLKVSGVEPTISTANIVSTRGGNTIEPGDRVVTRTSS